MRPHPHLYEIDARAFLERLSRSHDRPVTLGTVPESEWRLLARRGFDLVWLMGVWMRSPVARRVALSDPALRRAYDETLPGWTERDVSGSPYAVHDYRLDPALGEPQELAELREALHRHGMALVLDFVPNHLALDHPWTRTHPARFVRASDAARREHPEWFYSHDGRTFFAHGRDPNFPPWTDTVQVNFFSPELRGALLEEVLRIARWADGLRCDMAMLALNDVFRRVWGDLVDEAAPETEFWSEILAPVKRRRPGFVFLAEAYWDLDARLRELGFDFTYDKTFYDRLRLSPAREILDYVVGSASPERRVRFVENHDEPRAAACFGRKASLAALAVLTTVPGMRLIHDGQLEGRKIRAPVQLARHPDEDVDAGMSEIADRILEICDRPAYHDGRWIPLATSAAWDGNDSHRALLAWSWQLGDVVKLAVVNYSPHASQGRVAISWELGDPVHLVDELADVRYERSPTELRERGLYVDLGPWRAHLFSIDTADPDPAANQPQ